MSKGWTEGLFGCTNDITSCLITWCLPGGLCFIQAKAVDKATQQGMFVPYCLVCCLGVLGGALNRETIRNKLGLEGSCVTSCLVWCYCSHCAACQEYREVFRPTQ